MLNAPTRRRSASQRELVDYGRRGIDELFRVFQRIVVESDRRRASPEYVERFRIDDVDDECSLRIGGRRLLR